MKKHEKPPKKQPKKLTRREFELNIVMLGWKQVTQYGQTYFNHKDGSSIRNRGVINTAELMRPDRNICNAPFHKILKILCEQDE